MADRLPSKAQLDKLGDRLRIGIGNEPDLRSLDDYRRSFRDAYDKVLTTLSEHGLDGTGRPAKTTAAIIDKLNRQHIRLTQIQDIAGVRIIVSDVNEQDQVLKILTSAFGTLDVDDRRAAPSHGYRAVHAVVEIEERSVEIQLRTLEQHRWAEISEKFADLLDPAIKYGGGPEEARFLLQTYSDIISGWEEIERGHRQKLQGAHLLKITAEQQDNPDVKQSFLKEANALESTVAKEREELGELVRGLGDKMLAMLANMRKRD